MTEGTHQVYLLCDDFLVEVYYLAILFSVDLLLHHRLIFGYLGPLQ